MGDMADAIINGDFDAVTGEWLGEGDGFPRTTVRGAAAGYYYMGGGNGSKPKTHPYYNTIRQLVNVNPAARGMCHNKKGTMTFIQKYLKHIGSNRTVGKSTKWQTLEFLVKEQKKDFKIFINQFNT